MLVDLPKNWQNTDTNQSFLTALHELYREEGISYPVRLSRGVYLSHINFDHEIEHLTWDNDNMRMDYANAVLRLWIYDLCHDDYDQMIEPFLEQAVYNNYGVCDHWSQILVKFPQLQTSVIPYLVRVSPIRKEDQPVYGGWRWHKWGPYIGAFQEQASQHEYLYDTPDVEEVFVYEVHEMRHFKDES